MGTSSPADTALLAELAPAAESFLERHLAAAKEWFPHELVPWSRGRDFEEGEAWDSGEYELDEGVRSALHLNLLTEDNLPYYYAEIDHMFGDEGAWGTWARRWTAEEGRHSIVIRDYLTVTRAIDPVVLERGRMAQVSGGVAPAPGTALEGFAYVALQELATRVSHHNTGKLLPDKAGSEVMKRVAFDENLHYLFYRDIVTAALEVAPSEAVRAIDAQATKFAMPGIGIPDFTRHARAIAKVGIYDFAAHHDQVLVPCVLRQWKLEDVTGLDAEGEKAREHVLAYLAKVGRAARRATERRSEQAEKVAANA